MSKYTDAAAIKEALQSAKHVLIIGPERPDIDSVSSGLALAKQLHKLEVPATLVHDEALKPSLSWIDGVDEFCATTADYLQAAPSTEAIVMLDMSGPAMAKETWSELPESVKQTTKILIDHHDTDEGFNWDLKINDAGIAANGILMTGLFEDWEWEVTSDIAKLLLLGILFDTDRFENANTDAFTLQTAAKLESLGADFYNTNREYQASLATSVQAQQVFGQILTTAKQTQNITYALIPFRTITTVAKETSFIKPVVNHLRGIKNTRVAFVVAEKAGNMAVVSMRANDLRFDVSKIAENHGGGGHKPAASCTIPFTRDLQEIADIILNEVKEQAREIDHV